ncbi:aldehyde dehydrogenase family protein [Brevundimonas sp.]
MSAESSTQNFDPVDHSALEAALVVLDENKSSWTEVPTVERIEMLRTVRTNIVDQAQVWVDLALKRKGLAADSPLAGEEWSSGPWVTLTTVDRLIESLSQAGRPAFAASFPNRVTTTDQLAVEVFPRSLFDRLLMSGVSAEIWMEPGLDRAALAGTMGDPAACSSEALTGKLSLVLGAGNITSIAPLDALHKLFVDDSVVILKLNPVLESLATMFERVLEPLISAGVLRIVTGGADVGAWLANHPLVQTLHITGSGQSHDTIVFGPGADGERRRAQASPLNTRPMTSELGGVSPTIVIPGHWTAADLRYQAEHVATQKLHNAGFNCVAAQMLILHDDWDQAGAFEAEVRTAIQNAPARPLYYPGTTERLGQYAARFPHSDGPQASAASDRLVTRLGTDATTDGYVCSTEVFGPAMSILRLPGGSTSAYLEAAIAFANDQLHGTLAANILIDPKTEKSMGPTFETAVSKLRYGTVGINAWSGLGYLLTQTPWGGFPGATLSDVQSGVGFVHNVYMFSKAQRSIVRAPFRSFPRNLLHGDFSLLPRPPWFVTNKRAGKVAKSLVDFQAKPGWHKLPGIFAHALRG